MNLTTFIFSTVCEITSVTYTPSRYVKKTVAVPPTHTHQRTGPNLLLVGLSLGSDTEMKNFQKKN